MSDSDTAWVPATTPPKLMDNGEPEFFYLRLSAIGEQCVGWYDEIDGVWRGVEVMSETEVVTITHGTTVHVGGMPFVLYEDVPAEGSKEDNLRLGLGDPLFERTIPEARRAVTVSVTLSTLQPMSWADACVAAALALLHEHGPKRSAEVDVTGAIREVG